MSGFYFIDIGVDPRFLEADNFSRRDILSFLGLTKSNDAAFENANKVQAQNLAVEAADYALQRREQGYIDETTVLVFRLDPSINWKIGSKFRQDLQDSLSTYGVARNPTNPQIILFSRNYAHFWEATHDPDHNIAKTSNDELLADLQSSELQGYISNSHVLYEHSQTAFFQTPAGSFHDYFIRIGNTQSLPAFAGSSFFWSLPFLEGVTHFFAESWSISTTAATFSTMQNTYSDTQVSSWAFGHSYFPKSPDDRARLRSELSRCAAARGKFLLLNSFNSSGKLSQEFARMSASAEVTDCKMLSLFVDTAVSTPDHPFLMDIAEFMQERQLKGLADLPLPPGSPVFSVNQDTYFPDYRRIKVWPFKFTELSHNKTFFERFSGKGIFRVNRRGRNMPGLRKQSTPGSMRHHAFHVDAVRLFDDQEFRDQLTKSWIGRPAPTALLTNGTEASTKLAEVCLATSGADRAEILVCDDPTFKILPETDGLETILQDPAARLLICVPLVITGDTLANVQVRLRELEKRFGEKRCDISIIVGLLRPESTEKVRQLESFYLRNRKNHDKAWVDPIIVESIVLPNWQENQCPWQREKAYLKALIEDRNISGDDFFRHSQRIEALSDAVIGGLSGSDVFNVVNGEHLRFNPESLWMDDDKVHGEVDFLGTNSTGSKSSEADICCAVASALQLWREQAAKKDWRFSVIDASTITNLNGFNEARLRAAIWRGLTREELKNTARAEKGSDLSALLRKIFFGPVDDENYFPIQEEARIAFRREIERTINTDGSSVG